MSYSALDRPAVGSVQVSIALIAALGCAALYPGGTVTVSWNMSHCVPGVPALGKLHIKFPPTPGGGERLSEVKMSV